MTGKHTGAIKTDKEPASQQAGQQGKKRRFRGFSSYILSLLLIVVPIGVAYYLHVQSQTEYRQERAFRALDEISRLMDDNVDAVTNLFQLLPRDFGGLGKIRDRKDLNPKQRL